MKSRNPSKPTNHCLKTHETQNQATHRGYVGEPARKNQVIGYTRALVNIQNAPTLRIYCIVQLDKYRESPRNDPRYRVSSEKGKKSWSEGLEPPAPSPPASLLSIITLDLLKPTPYSDLLNNLPSITALNSIECVYLSKVAIQENNLHCS